MYKDKKHGLQSLFLTLCSLQSFWNGLFILPKKVFVNWISACFTSPKFSININGELVGFFSSSRGLRQGDPLSPYLFVLAMNALDMILKKNISLEGDFTYHWRCEVTHTTHICFADDLLLFCGGSLRAAQIVKDSLDAFFYCSRLESNCSKSVLLVAGGNPSFKNGIVEMFGYPLGSLPLKYLGVPLISSNLSSTNCKSLLDKLLARIKSWTNRFLSFAGRL